MKAGDESVANSKRFRARAANQNPYIEIVYTVGQELFFYNTEGVLKKGRIVLYNENGELKEGELFFYDETGTLKTLG